MKKIILPAISSFLIGTLGATATVQFFAPLAQAQVQMSPAQQKLQRVQGLARILVGHGLMYSLYLNPVVEAELQGLANSNSPLLDSRLNAIVTRMASDLSRGRVLPSALDTRTPIKVKPFAYQAQSTNYLNGLISADQFMAVVAPKNRIYIEALTVLKTVMDIKAQNKWATKPAGLVLATIKKGVSINPAVITYARSQLANMGYANNISSTIADADLDAAIRAFQTDNALVADGVAGANTWRALDKSADQLITQAILNLDRTRWLPDQNAAEYIYVNLALQTFQYFENEKETMSFRTVNGRLDRQTPLMVDVSREAVLNPTWTVPRSIFVKDKLEKLRANPGYAEELHAKVYSDITGQEVSPYSIDWNQDPSRLPYTLVQSPGPWNALGRIKFPLTNDFAIYMHDTNERGLFAETDRLRSSGCVRLQKPFELGAKLLAGTKWTADALLNATELAPEQATQPTNVSLKRGVPVYLAYKTLTLSGGKMISSNDPYGLDSALYSLMFSGK